MSTMLLSLLLATTLAIACAQSGYNATISIPSSTTKLYMAMYTLPDTSTAAPATNYAVDVNSDVNGYSATVFYTDLNTHVLTVVGVFALDAGACKSQPEFGIDFDVFELVLSFDPTATSSFDYQTGFVRSSSCIGGECAEGQVASGVSTSTACYSNFFAPVAFAFTLSLV